MRQLRQQRSSRRDQGGAALIVSVLLLALIGVSSVLAMVRGTNGEAERDRQTEQALAQAKAALIGYAADVVLASSRLGELPCPDTDDDGTATIAATGLPEVCDTQDKRLGRLPWKTLGLPDLRDGSGERLWYAVSENFKRDTSAHCSTPTASDCINSESRGGITVRRDFELHVTHDGTNPNAWVPSGAIAVVIAPGAALIREGASTLQDRSAGHTNDAVNYLDVRGTEDNANFIDRDPNGFVAGPIRVAGDLVVNDRIAVIAYQDLIPVLEKRVAREVSKCLDQYAARPANNGRFPWAADMSQSALGNFSDPSGTRAGRIPDGIIGGSGNQLLTNTRSDSSGAMENTWPGSPCNLGLGLAWWTNWKLHVFYALADAFKPGPTGAPSCSSGSCLAVNTPTVTEIGKRYFVMVAGKRLASVNGGQPRGLTDLANPANYLEGENVFGASTLDLFEVQAASTSFNDIASYR